MSDVENTIRSEIAHHEAEIRRLKKMLEAGGARVGTIKEAVLSLLEHQCYSSSELAALTRTKLPTMHITLNRMRKEGVVARDGSLYRKT